MAKFTPNSSLADFQKLILEIYALPDDRLFSISDLLSNQERFTMRAIKGIRKGDKTKLIQNLMISFSWLMAVANRLHIDATKNVWYRFPFRCSYCGCKTCTCKENKIAKRKSVKKTSQPVPKSLKGFQEMFAVIYPPESRSLENAGIHLAEEMGELSEAIHNFLGEHTKKRFAEVELELADYISCIFGVANSANIDMDKVLAKAYYNNCHDCHESPCASTFRSIAEFKS